MPDLIQIKRSQANGTYPSLAAGELAYSELLPGQLAIGKPGGGGNDTIGPQILSAGEAPSPTPVKIGDVYVNTSNGDVFIAKGTTNSTDWSQVNGSGTGDMLNSENLSGLANDLTAVQNLINATAIPVKATPVAGDKILIQDSADTDSVAHVAFSDFGDMLKSENLSGLANYTTARSNLGLNALA